MILFSLGQCSEIFEQPLAGLIAKWYGRIQFLEIQNSLLYMQVIGGDV